MGSYKDRNRRPFIWQDEMVEVKNLFRKVAKVKSSGFTGFSVWKDGPTAETLSKNRLRRRRSQYALDLTHLNYSESPYEALNHLHNIRGMCSRIQRQDLYVERKKKDYDADLHPSLLRRPVTASDGSGQWDGGDRGSLRRRPSSAPYYMGTPLHYTAPKPTVLYDATHRCPRNKSFYPKRPSSSVSSSRSFRSVHSVRGAMWDSSPLSSTVHSTPVSASNRNHSVSQNTSTSYRLNTEYAMKEDVSSSPTPLTKTGAEFSTSELYSSEVEISTQDLSSSSYVDQRPPPSTFVGPATAKERPPSRQVRKRPPRHKQEQQVEKSKPERRDDFSLTVSSVSTPQGYRTMQAGVPDSPTSTITDDLISNDSRPSYARKDKDKLSDRSCGLWALKEHQHRPRTADSISPSRPGEQKQRPLTSSSHPNANRFCTSCPQHAKMTMSGSKNIEKEDDMPTVQSCIDHSEESRSETEYSELEKMPTSAHARRYGAKSCEHQASSSTGASEAQNSASAPLGEDSHVLIKHSTDPYADFKTSMMHMINEEGLVDKQWELDELFQYYMDLNPVIHHDILRRVISDIRKDLEAEKTSH